jgi:hypothetical protein
MKIEYVDISQPDGRPIGTGTNPCHEMRVAASFGLVCWNADFPAVVLTAVALIRLLARGALRTELFRRWPRIDG